MLTCEECGCVSHDGTGWLGLIAALPSVDETPKVVVYCPLCAEREFDWQSRRLEGYV